MAKKKNDVVNEALESFNSLYAGGGIVNLAEHPRFPQKITTGRPSIDYVTDGGFPKGRLILVAGEPSAGKSSLTIQVADMIGKKILYIDTESTLTTDYIEALGANSSKFFHCIPESTEQLCNIIRAEIPNFDVIVIDSINNSASEEQISKNAEEKTMANRAIVLSSQLPMIVGKANQYGTTLFVLSQVRDNMNKKSPYSPDKVVPGGNSLHHNSSMTLELSKSTKKKSKDSDELELYDTITGRMVTIKCTKNKVGKTDRNVKVEFTYGEGYTIEADIASAAIRLEILEKSGSWIKYQGNSLCQGQDALLPILKDNPELLEELERKINKINDK
jgi:recombination protein RecA